MKKYLFFILVSLFLASCSKEDIQTSNPTPPTPAVQTLNLYKTYYSQKVFYSNGVVILTDPWLQIEKETIVYSTDPADENKIIPQTKYSQTTQNSLPNSPGVALITSFKAVLKR